MANIFDDMQFNKHDSRCVTFTPAQYKIIYSIQYATIPLLKSLRQDMERWYFAHYYEYPEYAREE